MYKLYGDGIHDDTPALQEMIDSGVCEVILPPPEKHYLISKPLELPSNFRLVFPRFAHIRLADNSNCVMVKNKMVRDFKNRLSEEVYKNDVQKHIWSYIDDFSPDAPSENIELCGGIWDLNNENQLPNPEQGKNFSVREFYGCGMLFYNVKNLIIKNLTVKDPSQYGMAFDTVSYFTVENITFDYNLGNPVPLNMDGVHLDGNCHYGTIKNLKGACYDDLVAVNAHEGSRGDITNIDIDGIYAENCHSAVRLLTVKNLVKNIHITNVYGTYYQYVVGLTKFYPGENTGCFDGITLDNLYVSKCMPVKKGDFQQPPKVEQCFPVIWVQENTVVKNLFVSHLHRRETALPMATVHVGDNATVSRLLLYNITTEREIEEEMPLLNNRGNIEYLSIERCDSGKDEMIKLGGNGKIGTIEGQKTVEI